MARAKAVEEVEEEATAIRSRMPLHIAFSEYLEENYGITDETSAAETIAAAFAKRNEWRATDEYLAEFGPDAREARKADKAAARAAKPKAAKKATKKVAPAKKAPAKKAAPRKATKAAARAAASEEDVFE